MDLSTQYLGLDLASPLVPSASPLSRGLDTCRQLEDAGAGAIILWSLFEEALTAETETSVRFLSEQHTGFAEASHFLPNYHDYPPALDSYLEHLRRLKETLGIPVIASLNGVTVGGWIAYARALEAAGADALELNVYYVAANPEESGAAVEERYLGLLDALRHQVSLPINMKLSPNFSSVANMVKRLEAAGADGVALFNRFYQPDINLDSLRLRPALYPSTSPEALLAMRWIALLHGRVELSLGATGGVHTAEDALKLLLAGADVVHLCSLLLQEGPGALRGVREGIEGWMAEQGFETLANFRGRMSALAVPNPAEFERGNYVQVLDSYRASSGVLV
jgi:dihydroorotate dehydrogenase (fumarate)